MHVWYTKDRIIIHLPFKAPSSLAIPDYWETGRTWRREIPGRLNWEGGTEQPSFQARSLFMEKSLFIWTKNEIMLFMLINKPNIIQIYITCKSCCSLMCIWWLCLVIVEKEKNQIWPLLLQSDGGRYINKKLQNSAVKILI